MTFSTAVIESLATEVPITDGLIETDARQLPRHRIEYLDREGEISGGRGQVRRVIAGTFECLSEGKNDFVTEISWPRRALISVDGFLAFFLNAKRLEREIPGFRRLDLGLAALPVYPVFVGVLVSFCAYHVELALGFTPSLILRTLYPAIAVLAIAWVLPNYLRQAALQIVSSNVHYYEDVNSIHEETQVLHPSYLWPLQLFCFNFGTTHSFHHYVVDQPFYMRQLVAQWVLPYLRKRGVRENDTGTFARANRFSLTA